jgi:hypothetical protein
VKRWRYNQSFLEYQAAGNGVTTEAEESPMLSND